jgi:transformation/transcription domain-associated protein
MKEDVLIHHTLFFLGPDLEYSSVMLKMFKLIFMAVKSFPEKNQLVLTIHISTIITSSMKMSGKAQEPINYFNLLRALFRAISGGRFEALYTEVLPLLPVLLEGLNHMLATAQKQSMKELFVELCLTVPVRLSVLLPYLSYLMRPLVIALQAGPDLVSQGLRTLELCIDNLTHEFLEPIISPVIQELMAALWSHLQPEPYSHQISQTALRILGKLGGQNRKLLKDSPNLSFNPSADGGLEASVVFRPFEEMPKVLSLDFALDTVLQVFKEGKVDSFYLNKAFDFLKGSLPLLFDVDSGSDNLHSVLHHHVKSYINNRRKSNTQMDVDKSNEVGAPPPSPFLELPPVSHQRLESHAVAVRKVLVGLFYASRNQSLNEECTLLIENISRHFALLSVSAVVSGDPNGFISPQSKLQQQSRANSSASPLYPKPPITLDVILSAPSTRLDGFVNAMIEVMSCDVSELHLLAQTSLEIYYNACLTFLESNEIVEEMQIFRAFASKFSSCCYQPEWFKKNGGCTGIALLSTKLGLSATWLLDFELEFVRALLYVLKDTSSEMTSGNVEDATKTLYHILRVCNSPESTSSSAAFQQERTAKFNSLISLLISELSSSNIFVRETIQESFSILAKLTNVEVTELLTPVRDRLLTPIFAKPLRALPISMQIGHIDAITYCLSLRPSLLNFSDELLRLLHESLALADADDQALIIGKPSQYKNATLLTNLRVVCIKLLSAAMANSDFSNTKLISTRGRIIAMFFKSLYTKSSEVVDVAYKGKPLSCFNC